MRILFVSSSNMIAADVARLLSKEGHEVKLFIDDEDRQDNFNNIINKTDNWEKELDWVGKDGLIVFDDVGYGRVQDNLRQAGYAVFGGSELGDKLELDRTYAQQIMKKYGLRSLETHDFEDLDECIDFLSKSEKMWVLKQNDHKLNITTVAEKEDNSDIVEMINFCKKYYKDKIETVTLQEKVQGVEVGVGRFFNGQDWVGPIEIAFEHKRFFDGDRGPMTTEMGTLEWFDDDENNIFFQETIAKMKEYLQEINFKGDFQINFIANEDGIFPLEVTSRLGSPEIYLQSELLYLKWADFLDAVARGKNHVPEFKKGYGIVVLLAVPPFPYLNKSNIINYQGEEINFNDVSEEEFGHIFFEGVAKKNKDSQEKYYISDKDGYVLYVTSVNQTVEEARKKVYSIVEKINIHHCLKRTDIGLKFIESEYDLLKKWGYIK